MELINALKACLAKSQAAASSEASSGPHIEVLVGEECTAIKEEMQFKEQILLREISFELYVNGSQKYLLNFARSAQIGASVARIASFLCNDSLVYTDLCIHFEAAEIAAGCLVAASLIGQNARLHAEPLDFLSALDVPKDRVQAIAFVLIEMLEANDQKK